jgi:hypothetical protein
MCMHKPSLSNYKMCFFLWLEMLEMNSLWKGCSTRWIHTKYNGHALTVIYHGPAS